MSNNTAYQINAFPKLLVRDLAYSTRWYQEILGFELASQMPGPGGQPSLSHLRWSLHADLMLVGETSGASPRGFRGEGVTLIYLLSDDSSENLAARIRASGYTQLSGPHERPWNMRELIVIDPDGYRLTFTELLHQSQPAENIP